MHPSIFTQITFWSWAVLGLTWLISGLSTKKTVKLLERTTYLITSILIGLGCGLVVTANYDGGLLGTSLTPMDTILGSLGVASAIGGHLFAIWARLTLGRNWSGGTAALKQDHELIQSGPYHYVRHPIYTGFFFGMLGTALTLGALGNYLGVIFGLIAFFIRIRIEERLMMSQFPDTYQHFKQTSKTFIPFIY